MMACQNIAIILSVILMMIIHVESAAVDRDSRKYYLYSDSLSDGEHELRLHFGGIKAKQTSVGPSEGSPG